MEMAGEQSLTAWQKRLLPLMVSMLVLLSLFFCIAICVETYRVQQHIVTRHEIDLGPAFAVVQADQAKTFENQTELARFQAAALLESSALQSRYHQATMALMIRICIVFLGFLTGMVLALVGAAFILGKLREVPTNLEAKTAAWHFTLTTASPGLLLVILGAVLMVTTILARIDVNVTDAALYLPPANPRAQRSAAIQTVPAGGDQGSAGQERRSDVLNDLGTPKPK
jgi:hypothetical protein